MSQKNWQIGKKKQVSKEAMMEITNIVLTITATSGTVGGISAGFTVGFFNQINMFRPLTEKIPERYLAELLISRYNMLIICFLFSVGVLLVNTALGILSLYFDFAESLLPLILVLFGTGLYSLLIPLFVTTIEETRLSRALVRGA